MKARAIQQRLITQYPEEIQYRQRMAEIINVLGFVYSKRLQYADAIHCFEAVQEICQSLLARVSAGPKPVKLLNLLALSHYNIATIHIVNREFDQALVSLEKSLKYRSELAAAHPRSPGSEKTSAKLMRSWPISSTGPIRMTRRFPRFRCPSTFSKSSSSLDPDEARHHGALGRSFNALGYFHDELRHNLQAIPAFEKAVQEHERAIAQSPDDNEYKIWYVTALENLGEQYVDLGQVDRGLPYYRREIQIRRQLFTAHPEKRAYLLDLADGLSTLGNIQRHAGDLTAALRRSPMRGASWNAARPRRPVMTCSRSGSARHSSGRQAHWPTCESRRQARLLLDRAVKTLSDAAVFRNRRGSASRVGRAALWELARYLARPEKDVGGERVRCPAGGLVARSAARSSSPPWLSSRRPWLP